jgi:prophage DNA circulation protein
MSFDSSLPRPYKENWREAYRYDDNDAPRLSTYQAPGPRPAVPFIYGDMQLSGGQSVDTGEYPFFGQWSNTTLNEKPQGITVNGFVRGATYIKNRNALADSLLVHTDDDTPGYLDLPLWGRFPVVLIDYALKESASEGGQCTVSLTFTRAGVTIQQRAEAAAVLADAQGQTEAIADTLAARAVADFVASGAGDDPNTLAQTMAKLKDNLLGIVGKVQGGISAINNMSNEVTQVTSLIAQGIRSPKKLAQALVSAVASLIAGMMEIKNALVPPGAGNSANSGTGSAGSDDPDSESGESDAGAAGDSAGDFLVRDNEKNALLTFVENRNFTLDIETPTVKAAITKSASENLYKALSFYASALLLPRLENVSYQQMLSFWELFEQLEHSLNMNNPSFYAAVRDMRLAVGKELESRDLSNELSKNFPVSVPLLFLAQYLGTGDETLRDYNDIMDSFAIQGEVKYV